MLLDDQWPTQRHHEEHSEVAADEREHEDPEVFQIESKEDQRWQGKDDPRGD